MPIDRVGSATAAPQAGHADGLTEEHMQDQLEHPHLVHPKTGRPLRPVYVSPKTGRVYWPVLGASTDDGDGGGDGGDGGDGGGDGRDAFTAITSQEEFDKVVQDRVRRAQKKGYDDASAKYKDKAEKHDALEAELASDKDKAVDAARNEERDKATSEYTPRLVRQAFKAEAKGVLSKEQLDSLLEDLDLTKYVDDDGDVDEDKISRKIKAFAPSGGGDDSNRGNRGLGQGQRRPAGAKPGDAGRAEAQRRFGDRANSAVKQNA